MEPTLENISDYNTLKGEKKRVVYAVVISGLIIGGIYGVFNSIYATPKDSIQVNEKIKAMPLQ